jgi:hypothetical protein
MIISRDFPVERLVSRALPQILSLWFATVMLRRGNGGRKGSGYFERLGGQPTLLEDVGGIALGAMKSPAQVSPGRLSADKRTPSTDRHGQAGKRSSDCPAPAAGLPYSPLGSVGGVQIGSLKRISRHPTYRRCQIVNDRDRPVLAVGAQEANVSYASRCSHSVPAI